MRFRTRSQEVEAIQYTGDNAAEVMRFCDTASAHSDGKGFEWIQVLTSDNERVSVYAGEYIRKAEGGWVVQLREFFEARFVPVPDLIRTIADYEGLPDGTIIETVVTKDVLVAWGDGTFMCNGYRAGIEELVERKVACSVVRLGGGEQ